MWQYTEPNDFKRLAPVVNCHLVAEPSSDNLALTFFNKHLLTLDNSGLCLIDSILHCWATVTPAKRDDV